MQVIITRPDSPSRPLACPSSGGNLADHNALFLIHLKLIGGSIPLLKDGSKNVLMHVMLIDGPCGRFPHQLSNDHAGGLFEILAGQIVSECVRIARNEGP